jgi:hypothetical protein
MQPRLRVYFALEEFIPAYTPSKYFVFTDPKEFGLKLRILSGLASSPPADSLAPRSSGKN